MIRGSTEYKGQECHFAMGLMITDSQLRKRDKETLPLKSKSRQKAIEENTIFKIVITKLPSWTEQSLGSRPWGKTLGPSPTCLSFTNQAAGNPPASRLFQYPYINQTL